MVKRDAWSDRIYQQLLTTPADDGKVKINVLLVLCQYPDKAVRLSN
ncbi:hypothetical protein [Allocoleopsis franciscana]|nr:hypothetical protein [Allocoleopsis franciscana]